MKKAVFCAAAVVGTLALATAASAAEGHSRAERLKAMDANGDGKITRQEATDAAKARFKDLDKNGDGKLTADDFAGGKHDGSKFLKRLDTDGDGAVSEKEWVDRSLARFDRLDTDHDGVLSPQEQAAAGEGGSH